MHDSRFPESEEAGEARTARAIAALEYEDAAGLGFRRRNALGSGDPYATPDALTVRLEHSRGEIFGAWLAAIGVIAAGGSLVYKPILLALVAMIGGVAGLAGGGIGTKLGRLALVLGGVCWFLGMMFSVLAERPIY